MQYPPGKICYNSPQGEFILRPLRIEDTPAIFTARKLSEKSLKRFLVWAHLPCALHLQHQWVAQSIADFYLVKNDLNVGFFDKQGHFIGMGSWTKNHETNSACYEIGYWIASNYQKKGFGTLLGRLLTYTALTWMNAERLQVIVHTANFSSLRIIERCGFHYEGLLRNYLPKPSSTILADGAEPGTDVLLYALLPSDIQTLSWYEEIAKHTIILPLYEELN